MHGGACWARGNPVLFDVKAAYIHNFFFADISSQATLHASCQRIEQNVSPNISAFGSCHASMPVLMKLRVRHDFGASYFEDMIQARCHGMMDTVRSNHLAVN